VVHAEQVPLGYDVRQFSIVQVRERRAPYCNAVKEGPEDWKKQRVALQTMQERLAAAIAAAPGVARVSLSSSTPLDNRQSTAIFTPELRAAGTGAHYISRMDVSPGYFTTVGIPVRQGRSFTAADVERGRVAIVDEAVAALLWPGQNPIGRSVSPTEGRSLAPLWYVVVGVVANTRPADTIDGWPRPTLYLPLQDHPAGAIVLRAAGSASAGLDASLRVLAEQFASVDVLGARTAVDAVGQMRRARTTTTAILLAMALLATILATVGMYGLVSFTVAQQTREFGIRMALGARLADVIALISRQAVAIALAGGAAGLVAATGALKAITTWLFPVASLGWNAAWVVLAVAGLMAVVACAVPVLSTRRLSIAAVLRES
jgi:hypothetical protein